MMTFDAHDLAEVVLADSDEVQVRLGGLWERAPHVILFLRHFG
jgi:hypothetical protein